MLYVCCGSDTEAVREQAMVLLAQYADKGYQQGRIEADQYESGMLPTVVNSSSLFNEAAVYLLDTVDAKEEFLADIKTCRTALGETEQVFVLVAGKLLAPEKKQYATIAKEVYELNSSSPQRFNTFALSDALAEKNKKQLWLLWQSAQREGVAAEEVIGVLWWQLKMLLLASRTGSAAEAGVKAYPYQKAKRAIGNFAPNELDKLADSLLVVYHDGHAGIVDIHLALESWLLRI